MEQQQHPSKRRRLNVEGERQGECIGTDDAINGGNGQRGRTKSKAEKIALEWLRNLRNIGVEPRVRCCSPHRPPKPLPYMRRNLRTGLEGRFPRTLDDNPQVKLVGLEALNRFAEQRREEETRQNTSRCEKWLEVSMLLPTGWIMLWIEDGMWSWGDDDPASGKRPPRRSPVRWRVLAVNSNGDIEKTLAVLPVSPYFDKDKLLDRSSWHKFGFLRSDLCKDPKDENTWPRIRVVLDIPRSSSNGVTAFDDGWVTKLWSRDFDVSEMSDPSSPWPRPGTQKSYDLFYPPANPTDPPREFDNYSAGNGFTMSWKWHVRDPARIDRIPLRIKLTPPVPPRNPIIYRLLCNDISWPRTQLQPRLQARSQTRHLSTNQTIGNASVILKLYPWVCPICETDPPLLSWAALERHFIVLHTKWAVNKLDEEGTTVVELRVKERWISQKRQVLEIEGTRDGERPTQLPPATSSEIAPVPPEQRSTEDPLGFSSLPPATLSSSNLAHGPEVPPQSQRTEPELGGRKSGFSSLLPPVVIAVRSPTILPPATALPIPQARPSRANLADQDEHAAAVANLPHRTRRSPSIADQADLRRPHVDQPSPKARPNVRLDPNSLALCLSDLDQIYPGTSSSSSFTSSSHMLAPIQERDELIWSFCHLSEKQKLFMCLWNRYSLQHGPLRVNDGNRYLKGLIGSYGGIIKKHGLEKEFWNCLRNQVDHGLISLEVAAEVYLHVA